MKIVFITYHNWDTKRHGGFHALAEYCCKKGHETIFFSFARPYYTYFMHEERLSRQVLLGLMKGKKYVVGDNSITNITWPTLSIKPGRLRCHIPKKINRWLDTHSLTPFVSFSNRWLQDTDCFVIESNESILLYDYLRKYHPKAKIVYRPSDPIVDYNPQLREFEISLVKSVDMNFIVNNEGVNLYKKYISDFESTCKFKILVNGIYLDEYKKKYNRPEKMQSGKVVLYVGVEPIEWNLVFECAKAIPSASFYVIMPEMVSHQIEKEINSIKNLTFIPGIPHSEVASWITNCDVVMTPMVTGFHNRRKSFHIAAKNLKPIAAKKPIVTYCNNPCLSDYGITTTYEYKDFIDNIKKALQENERNYKIDLSYYNWENICELFVNTIKEL